MNCPNCGADVKNMEIHRKLCAGKATIEAPPVPTPVPIYETLTPGTAAWIECWKSHPEYQGAMLVIQERLRAKECAPAKIPETDDLVRFWDELDKGQMNLAEPIESKPSVENGRYHVFNPEVDPDFLVSEDIKAELAIADKISAKHPVNILVTGQPGGGKTSLGLQFAAVYKRPCVVVDFGSLQEPQELFHTTYLTSKNGVSETDIRESGFVRGLETPRCVVVKDELNRPENERVLNVLLPFLDGRRESYVDYLRRNVRVADGVIFIATLNEGAMFCGITQIDTALRDRYREIHMPYLPLEMEAEVINRKTGVDKSVALMLASFGHKVRIAEAINRKVSTRQLLTAAENFAHGDELWRAVSVSIGHHNDIGWREQVMEVFSFSLTDSTENQKWVAAKARRVRYERL